MKQKDQVISLSLPKCQITPRGLIFDNSITFEEWEQIGTFLHYLNDSIQFFLGDWANFGEKAFSEMYAQALDIKNISYGTFANYKYVASRIDISRRREKLSFGIHQEVAPLEPQQQDEVLDLAERENLSVKEVRKLIKELKTPKPKAPITGQIILRTGNFMDIVKDMQPNSIDHIIADPPHNGKYLDIFDDIGVAGDKVLRAGGLCILRVSVYHLSEIIQKMCKYLSYYWQIVSIRKQEIESVHPRQINHIYRSYLIFCKEPFPQHQEYITDVIETYPNIDNIQNVVEVQKLLNLLTHPGETILNPMIGNGDIALACIQNQRNVIGIDIDQKRIDNLKNTIDKIEKEM